MANTMTLPPPTEIPFELEALRDAENYRRWIFEKVAPFLGNRTLELGSGIGNLSQHLPIKERLILSDVEAPFVELLKNSFESKGDSRVSVVQMTPGGPLPETLWEENLDTIVSFNVLEHVEDDAALLRQCIDLLARSSATGQKRIVSLVPAMEFAYGSIDRFYGHHRRYNRRSFQKALESAGAKTSNENPKYFYMNLVGLLGWYVNGRVFKKERLGKGPVQTFEKLVPLLKPLDNFLYKTIRLPVGNSLIAIYEVNK
jgi:SAM-dependent methyltransferase